MAEIGWYSMQLINFIAVSMGVSINSVIASKFRNPLGLDPLD